MNKIYLTRIRIQTSSCYEGHRVTLKDTMPQSKNPKECIQSNSPVQRNMQMFVFLTYVDLWSLAL